MLVVDVHTSDYRFVVVVPPPLIPAFVPSSHDHREAALQDRVILDLLCVLPSYYQSFLLLAPC